MVSVLAFYCDDPSSNSAEVYSFRCNLFEKTKTKKRLGRPNFMFSVILFIRLDTGL